MSVPCPSFEQRGAGARTLVFLHGIGGDWTSFAPQLDHFADGYRAVSWTMPGYGASPPLPEMSFAGLADAVAVLLDKIEAPSAVVIGHSMGGMVAQAFAERHPDRLDGLVLSCTTAAFGNPDSDFAEKFLAARMKPLDEGKTPADIAPGLIASMMTEGTPAAMRELATASMSAIEPDAYRAALTCLVTFDGRDAIKRIPCPTLLIAGGEDRTAPPEVMERMAPRIPNARYVCLDGAGHLANLEQPDAFNAALADFLEAL